MTLTQLVLDAIVESKGCKASAIGGYIWRNRKPPVQMMIKIPEAVERLLAEGKIVEVIYTVPPNHAVDRFLLPRGSSIQTPEGLVA